MYRSNFVEIEPAAIAHNVRALRERLNPGAALMAVVKANGYGHGALTAARAALSGGAQMLAVATVEEGEALRLGGVAAPVLVLGNAESVGAQAAVRLGLAQTVYDRSGVDALREAARSLGFPAAVHLKVDTGMGRLGVRGEAEAVRLAREIAGMPELRAEGVFTHFACADEPERDDYTRMQMRRFEAVLAALEREGLRPALRHAANSAATLRFPMTHYDLVRTGIAMYDAPPVGSDAALRPAMRWVTRASLVKEIEAGESVSYGAAFTAARPTRVMTLPVGYADGYRRALAGQASVLVRGRRAPIIGRVCMDQCMADVTDIPSCAAGDEVVLMGAQGDAAISAEELAGWMGTIAYEALLAPSARVPRVVREGGV